MAKFSPEKINTLKEIGLTDEEIAGLSDNANATEKAATDQHVAFKAEEPPVSVIATDAMPGQRFKVANGDEYIKSPSEFDPTGAYYAVAAKAFPPKMGPAVEEADAVIEEDAIGEMPTEEEVVDENALTLSAGDLAAIQGMIAQVMGALELEKKVAGHVQGLMAPYTAQKDSEQAERDEKIASLQATLKTASDQQTALKAQLDELLGLQPAVTPRATESAKTVINPWIPQDAQLLESIKNQAPNGEQFAFGDLVQNLFGTQTTG